MSHELRTPLSSMLGFSELLVNDKNLNDGQRESALLIYESGEKLLHLLTDLLELSVIESGKMKFEYTTFNIKQMVHDIYILLKANCEKKRIIFKSNIAIESTFYSDPLRIRQILFNLIGNAVKFTENGEVLIEITENETEYLFKIEDTGIGIDEANKDRIFGMFMRSSDPKAQKYSGTGLGLAICKRLVEIMRGRMWVESEVSKGSKFFFTVPKQHYYVINNVKTTTEKKKLNNYIQLNILYAEDDKANFRYIEKLVNYRTRHKSKGYYNGKELVEEFRKNVNYDLIILDIQMPEMNGLQCLKEIRKINRKIPVIALTAFALQGDNEKFIAEGFNEYISKPLNPPDFIDLLTKYEDYIKSNIYS